MKGIFKGILICFTFLPFTLFAQEGSSGIRAIGRAKTDSVILRWAPNSPAAWQILNRFGYHIERFTILRNNAQLAEPERVQLTREPLKPAPLPYWKQLAETNDYAAIAAQAIYGESFEVSGNYQSDIVQVIQAAKEVEQRFSFALFAADMSPEVARKSGLWYTDKEVNPNEKYLYRVISAAPTTVLAADTGLVFISPRDTLSLPRPVRVSVEFGDKMAVLRWNKKFYEQIYMAYQVERSADGVHFEPITALPITNTDAPTGYKPEYMFKLDSLPRNGQTYHYRVRGYTPFGELGPPSEQVSGKGFVPLKSNPAITSASKINTAGRVELAWEFPVEDEPLLKGFTLLRAKKANGNYKVVAEAIAPESRSFVDQNPLTVNYYKLEATGKEGGKVYSFPYLIQLPDSIPPSAPKQLQGTVDSLGNVRLSWQPSPEEDVAGYRIFRSNFANNEYAQLTVDPVNATSFADQINVKTLNDKIYYKVTAVDHFHNPSAFSAPLVLEKPDVLPPAMPVFSKLINEEQGIRLAWEPSPSADVEKHMLYRRLENKPGWELIAFFTDTTTSYFDKELPEATYAEYTLLAVDKSGLESEPAKPARGRRLSSRLGPELEYLKARVKTSEGLIELRWKQPETGVESYSVYRARAEEPLTLYKTIQGTATQFMDEAVAPATQYSYRMQVHYQDGRKSALSETVKVSF